MEPHGHGVADNHDDFKNRRKTLCQNCGMKIKKDSSHCEGCGKKT